jgi:acyl-CoA synthetase (AMP-forming)/AMP-acid ligase II
MLLFLSQHPGFDAADLSCIRCITVGGAPMPESLLQLYEARGVAVIQGFGMTETTSTVSLLSPDRAHAKLGSSGTAALMCETRLTDRDGRTIAQPHVRGELCVRGSNVMLGYWGRPDATAQAFDDDGWFHTGDVAYQDEDGFLYICDRLKDMVISGGENVYPAEVESVLYQHPARAGPEVGRARGRGRGTAPRGRAHARRAAGVRARTARRLQAPARAARRRRAAAQPDGQGAEGAVAGGHVITADGCTGDALSTTFTNARSYSTSPPTSSKSLSSSSPTGVSSVMSLWFTTRSFGLTPVPAPLSEPGDCRGFG